MPEVGDGDDDQQVKSHGDERNGGKQNINQQNCSLRVSRLLAGGVQVWNAEFRFLQCFHRQRGKAAELWQPPHVQLFYPQYRRSLLPLNYLYVMFFAAHPLCLHRFHR